MESDIFEMVFDTETKCILQSAKDIPKSTNQIISECNLAKSTAYRKLKKLSQMNLLSSKYVFNEYNKREFRYQSNLYLVDKIE